MSQLFDEITNQLTHADRTIVFPEGADERVLTAASQLAAANIVTPVLLGDEQAIYHKARTVNADVSSCGIINPRAYAAFDEMVQAFVERRKGKVTDTEAREMLLDENYFGTMLVYLNKADGLVSGANHSTAETVRPALQIIKTKAGVNKTSGAFIMVRGDEKYVFADCAINMTLDSQDLAEIAVESAKTGELFGIDPRVAMLSFSTKGSAQSEETEKVVDALEAAKTKNPALVIDGEFQFDAAFVPSVASKKAPDATIQGDANVFVFPSLEAGNIGYKMAQRLGQFDAVGPILQGLNQPVNDLSRGCSVEDVYNLALITAAQV